MRGLWQKKLLVVALLGFVLLALSLMVAPVTTAEGNGALVIHPSENNDTCKVLDQNGNTISADSSMAVITYNDNKNALYRCEASGIENDTGSAINFYGSINQPCSIILSEDGSGVTYTDITGDWHQVISASGNLVLTCQFKS